MPNIPGNSGGGLGSRQQRAAELREQAEREQRMATAQTEPVSQQTQNQDAVQQAEPQSANFAEPAGQGDYLVKVGDCIAKIAKETGHFWDTIWTDPANSELKEARKDPNVLRPGDRVTIPEKEEKQESGVAEMRHRFKRKGEPSALNLQFMSNDEPLANKPYKLILDNGSVVEGSTDAEGKISNVSIPGNAKKGKLHIKITEDEEAIYELMLGAVCPHDDLGGVQNRLRNLGYGCEVTGKLDAATRRALRKFQEAEQLQATGEPDDETMKKLEEKFGS